MGLRPVGAQSWMCSLLAARMALNCWPCSQLHIRVPPPGKDNAGFSACQRH